MFLGRNLDDILLTDSMLDSLGLTLNPPDYTGPAKLILPPMANSFHSILAIDDNNAIINNSNSFLSDTNLIGSRRYMKEYDLEHSIFLRIYITHKYLSETPEDTFVENEMFLLCNPFSSTNIGHDLSILFHRINIYREQKLTIPVVLSEFMFTIPRSLEICKMLLPNTEFYMLPNNKIVKFRKLHITGNVIMDIKKHPHIIREVIESAVMSIPNINEYKNRKILIIKTTRNKNVITKRTCFSCEKTIEYLTSKLNYTYINPEIMPMNEIIAYLFSASKIVCSFGAILYAHAIFFNPNINYIFLDVANERRSPYYDKEKYKCICVTQNLDTEIPELLSLLGENISDPTPQFALSLLNTHTK